MVIMVINIIQLYIHVHPVVVGIINQSSLHKLPGPLCCKCNKNDRQSLKFALERSHSPALCENYCVCIRYCIIRFTFPFTLVVYCWKFQALKGVGGAKLEE